MTASSFRAASAAADHHIGSRIRQRRMILGMSQETLASALNLTFQQVQKYEKGTNRVGSGGLQTIATILQAPVSWFYEGAPGASTNGNTIAFDYGTQFLSSREGVAIAEAWPQIKPRARKALVEMVKVLADEGDELDRAKSDHEAALYARAME